MNKVAGFHFILEGPDYEVISPNGRELSVCHDFFGLDSTYKYCDGGAWTATRS